MKALFSHKSTVWTIVRNLTSFLRDADVMQAVQPYFAAQAAEK
jgi:hypothetical protein